MPHQIKLCVVDDHILFRKTLVNFLSQQKAIEVSFEASDAYDLFNKLKREPVDILLMDIFMPHINGTDALTIIRNEYPDIRIIMLSMCTDVAVVSHLLDIGIHGYISKADDPEELLKAVVSAKENRIYRNKLFTDALYWGSQNNMGSARRERKVSFDDREKMIIQLLWEEKNNKQIAEQLFLSVRSIEKIRQDIKEKLGVKTTVGLLKYALDKRIINLTNIASLVKAS
jgi:DNA-binding NarL/FixJ family response regulator